MPRPVPRPDRDAGGPAEILAAKAALRQDIWAAMTAAKAARFPGAAGRIPNFTGAEAAAERLRGPPEWQGAGTGNANPGPPAAAGAPAGPGGRQARLHGRAAAGRARAVLRAGPG